MSDNLICIAEVNIQAGQLDALKALIAEMAPAIERDEPGTLNYECFIADDGKSYHVYERYADSDACMVHLGIFGQKFAARVMPLVTITKITLYGNPSDAVREVFAAYNPTIIHPFVGVAR